MQMVPQEFFQKTDRNATGPTLIQSPRTVNCGGESSSLRPPLPPLPLRQAVEAAGPEAHASTITLATQPSRDTTVTMETTTTTSPPAHSTLTHQHIRRHHTPLTASALKKGVSGGEGNVALQGLSRLADPRRGGHSPGSAPTTTPQDRH